MFKKKYIYYLLTLTAAIGLASVMTSQFHWADFHVYHTAGNSFYNGRVDLYSPTFGDDAIMDYRYPPFFLFLILPLSRLEYQTAEFCWLWINAAVIFLAIRTLRNTLLETVGQVARLDLIFVASFLLCAKYFVPLLRNLNVHLMLLGLIFIAFCLVLKKKAVFPAVLFALCITFKAFPIVLLPYFAIKRQWRFLLLTAGLIVVFNLLPALYFGFDTNLRLLGDWFNHVLVNNEFHNTNGPLNVSIQGQLERFLTVVDYSKRVVDTNYDAVNVAELSKRQADLIGKTASAVIYFSTLILIWLAHNRRRRNTSPETPSNQFDSMAFHEFGFLICAMLIAAPRSNVYFFLALFFPLIAFLHSFFRRRTPFKWLVLISIFSIACLSPLVPGAQTQRLFLVLGLDLCAALLLWIALGYQIVKANDEVIRNDEVGMMNDE